MFFFLLDKTDDDLFVVVCSVFFFKQKTAYEMRISDWSSDVCSSDLRPIAATVHRTRPKSSWCSVGTAVSKDAGLMPDARGTSRRPPHPVPEVSMPLTDSTARAGERDQVHAAAHVGSCPQRDKPWVLVAAVLGATLALIDGPSLNLRLPGTTPDLSTQVSGWPTEGHWS